MRSEFVGLYYYRAMFGGFDFPRIMLNDGGHERAATAGYALPVVFAILLCEVRIAWFRRSVQTVSTFPHFVSWLIVFSLSFSMIETMACSTCGWSGPGCNRSAC